MNFLRTKFTTSPATARVAPFVIFLVLTGCQGWFGEAGRYWFYLAKTVAGAWLVWEMRPLVSEMRWTFSWEAVAIGIAVVVVWIGLDPYYPRLSELTSKIGLTKARSAAEQIPWNPALEFGKGTVLAWFFLIVRFAGPSLVVPPLEEVFYRSFLYRYLVRVDFQSLPLRQLHWVSLFVTALIFASTHEQWLAAIFCGLAYQWLVLRKNRLGDAMAAHAITNFLLGIWVVWKGAWNFW